MDVLFIILALDLAGYAHGDIGSNAAAVIALVCAIVQVVLLLRARA